MRFNGMTGHPLAEKSEGQDPFVDIQLRVGKVDAAATLTETALAVLSAVGPETLSAPCAFGAPGICL
jgi:hypothetical protein